MQFNKLNTIQANNLLESFNDMLRRNKDFGGNNCFAIHEKNNYNSKNAPKLIQANNGDDLPSDDYFL